MVAEFYTQTSEVVMPRSTVTDRDAENANKLLTGSIVFATNSREGFTEQYPTLQQISPEDWTSLLAVAGAGTALLMIPGRYDPPAQKELTAAVMSSLHEWNEAAVPRLAEFVNFVTTTAKDSNDVPDTIGTWVLRDLKLESSEHSAAHVLGVILMNTFGPWWDQ
jgi:hypothetical protein